VNEVSFRARPYHNVYSTLGVDAGATGPRSRVDSIEGGRIGKGGREIGGGDGIRLKDTSNREPIVLPLWGYYHC
jgi:hypothetical protein